jgi:Protein of unknown function (DUF2950)
MVRESIGDWVSVLDSSLGLAGDGMVGDTIGAAAGASTTTTRTSRIAGASSIVVVFDRTGRTSVVPPPRAHWKERVPALSAASIMGSLRDPVPFGANPALAVFTAGALAGSAAGASAGVSTAAEVGDSSREVMQTEKREMMNMINLCFRNLSERVRSATFPLAILVMLALGSAREGLAQQSARTTFPSSAEAGQALFQAVQSNNGEVIANILGGPSELTASGNEAQDRLDREMFVQKYQEMHRLGRDANGSVTLYIGSENWPFPIPLVEKNGSWRFDPDTGLKEVLFRRIGENELRAILICHELVAAERQFRANQKAEGQVDSALTNLVSAAASGSASGEPVLIHGYYFRVVAKRRTDGKTAGGFGFVAYPAEYRSSGVMTFIIIENDVVKEKDLGTNTSALASTLGWAHKETGWVPSDDK